MARPETICFRSSKNPIHLLQLPAELAEIIESRSTCASATAVPLDRADLPPILSVALRGDPKDEAHLVTPNATFLLKSVQTSNSMLLVAPQGGSSAGFQLFSTPGGGSAQYGILETSGSYVEVLPTAAKLSRIKSMLDQAPFRGFDQEDESEASGIRRMYSYFSINVCWRQALGYTLEDFKSCVQASDAEIGACLDELDAMEIQGGVSRTLSILSGFTICLLFSGRWRLLDTSYTQAVLSAIVDSAVANGMDLGNVDMAEIIAVSLDADYPAEVLQHVFRCFFTPLEKRSLGETLWLSDRTAFQPHWQIAGS